MRIGKHHQPQDVCRAEKRKVIEEYDHCIDQTEEKSDLDPGMIGGVNINMGEKPRMFVELETWGRHI